MIKRKIRIGSAGMTTKEIKIEILRKKLHIRYLEIDLAKRIDNSEEHY